MYFCLYKLLTFIFVFWQKWNHIASNQGSKETEEKEDKSKQDESLAAGTTTDKKRKREEDDKENNNNEKKLKAKNVFAKSGGGSLNKSTINKLANFARDWSIDNRN